MIQFGVEDGVWTSYNIGEANVGGVELDLQVSPKDFLSAGFNFAISRAVDGLDNWLMYQPEKKAGGFAEVARAFKDDKLEGRILISGEFVGKRLSETREELPGYHLFHTRFMWRILDVTFFLRLENLLDCRYEVRQGYPMPGREHMFGLEWEFWD